MKFICTVARLEGSDEPWEESYDQPGIHTLAAEKWALFTVAKFNATLRPFEKPRKLVSVVLAGASQKHQWFKVSACTVVDPRLGMYDQMKCKNCEVTGKRFNLNQYVKIDSKFRAKKYQTCTGAL